MHPLAQHEALGTVRPLRTRDIPALVALRQQAFRHSERRTPDALAAFFRTVFFDSPWRDESLPSLVHETDDGVVTGFLGVIPRRMTLRGRPIRVAIGTQLMVAPGARGLVGRKLARTFFDGPQDLSLGDSANDAARRLWLTVGGYVSPMLSMCWVKRLRPWRHATLRLGAGVSGRMLRFVAAPVADALDRVTARTAASLRSGARVGSTEPLTAAAVCRELDAVLRSFALRPAYDAPSLTWQLSLAGEKRQFGPIHSAFVRGREGMPLGWFLYYLDGDGIAHVLQIVARDDATEDVLRCACRDAWERGAIALSGRAEPWLMGAVLAAGDIFVYQGPWTLLHARRPEVVDLIERGNGYLSRLDGEWWLSF